MSTPAGQPSKESGQPGLFSDEELPAGRRPGEAAPTVPTAARVRGRAGGASTPHPCAPRTNADTDTTALAHWRRLMANDEGRQPHHKRGATVECAKAQLRRRVLLQFNVRGLVKARTVVLWHALAHILMRPRSLDIAPTA